ncbi:flotillin family protein [Demequina salsinemoris]|uniref:flotillin family protein n=1 Tax=Demequina salsinemoris TaxID=577470 RepID=UPI000783FD4A|nr:flotillin family protein [Demequina salsinemoris]
METITIIAIVGGVVAALAVVGAIVSRYKVSDPDEALIISGSKSKEAGGGTVPSRVVLGGGGVFVWPFVQKHTSMSLETRQIAWTVRESPSSQNILVNLEGVANVKVGGDERAVRDAAERFNVNPKNIEDFVTQNIEGDMRAIVGTMTVEEINSDRETLKDRVLRVTGEACAEWGLVLEGLNIQSVTTPSGYINDLGRIEAAAVRRNAEIAEANTQRESEEAKAKAQQAIADANRELTLRIAAIKQDTDTAEAKANSAGPIAAAEQQVLVFEQERIAESKRAEVTEMRLASEVSKPADARAYATKVEAEALAAAQVAKAEANATTERLEGDSQAAANRARGEAEAAVTQAKGAAEATAIEAKGKAEAAGIDAKAEAYRKMPEQGFIEVVLDGLPGVIREASAPMGAIDNLTVVSTEGAGALTKTVASTLTQGLEVIKGTTGIDVLGMFSKDTETANGVAMGDFGAARAALVKAEASADAASADKDAPVQE